MYAAASVLERVTRVEATCLAGSPKRCAFAAGSAKLCATAWASQCRGFGGLTGPAPARVEAASGRRRVGSVGCPRPGRAGRGGHGPVRRGRWLSCAAGRCAGASASNPQARRASSASSASRARRPGPPTPKRTWTRRPRSQKGLSDTVDAVRAAHPPRWTPTGTRSVCWTKRVAGRLRPRGAQRRRSRSPAPDAPRPNPVGRVWLHLRERHLFHTAFQRAAAPSWTPAAAPSTSSPPDAYAS